MSIEILDNASAAAQGCRACKQTPELFPFSMAFQPIISISSRTVFAYEALVRGPQGESAYSVLSQINETNRYAFDQNCRVRAIELAASLGVADQGSRLSVNFLPGAVYSPAACIQQTLRTARETSFPLGALIFEITEVEQVNDPAHIERIVSEYHKHGFSMALDDFGSGYSGLNLLSELDVEFLKLDARLIRNIDRRPRAQAILHSVVNMARAVGTRIIGECVETIEEFAVLHNSGIDLMQGYLFAKPQFEGLPEIAWDEIGLASDRQAFLPTAHAQSDRSFTSGSAAL